MKKVIIGAFALAMVVFACQKEEIKIDKKTNSQVEQNKNESQVLGDYDENIKNCAIDENIKYFLNGVEVRPGTFNPADENLYGILHSPDEENNNFYYFSQKEDYFQFGRENGYGNTLEGGYNFEIGMRAYIENNNVEEYFEQNGELPIGYIEFERELYQREVMGNQDRGMTWLFLNYTGGGSTTSVTGYKPFFASAQYNNAISRYKQFASATVVWGWMNVYDKKWYKNKLNPTVGHVTWDDVWFDYTYGIKYMDNKMSSCVAL